MSLPLFGSGDKLKPEQVGSIQAASPWSLCGAIQPGLALPWASGADESPERYLQLPLNWEPLERLPNWSLAISGFSKTKSTYLE